MLFRCDLLVNALYGICWVTNNDPLLLGKIIDCVNVWSQNLAVLGQDSKHVFVIPRMFGLPWF